MNKDTKEYENFTPKIDVKALFDFLSDRQHYQFLVGDRWNNFRKELFDLCDECVTPKAGHITWKKRFLSPDSIPARGKDYIIVVMAEKLAFMLQKQHDFLIDKLNYKENSLNKLQEDIKLLKNRIEGSENSVEHYKSICHEKEEV